MLVSILLFIISFIAIWYGSGLIVSSTGKLAGKLRLSPFAFSFIFLGILTSTPELSIGLQSIADRKPEIFVGNLIGGIAVIFLLIIPLLAILGKGINLKNELNNSTTITSLLVIFAPALAVLDKRVTFIEGLMLIGIYILLLIQIERKHGVFDRQNSRAFNIKSYSYKDILKVIAGIILVFASSAVIVDKTLFFSEIYNISSFYIGLLVISLGTNLPELSLAIRSILLKHKDIAMGDYMGSASANTFLFGLFTIINGGEFIAIDNFLTTFIFVSLALLLFYIFSYKNRFISRTNGLLMLGVYILFVIFEFIR